MRAVVTIRSAKGVKYAWLPLFWFSSKTYETLVIISIIDTIHILLKQSSFMNTRCFHITKRGISRTHTICRNPPFFSG